MRISLKFCENRDILIDERQKFRQRVRGGASVFGYVTVYKEAVSAEDYELFRSYYCGLCKEMGKRCSQISRLGLSYDITFLAIVLSAVYGDGGEVEERACIAHPFKKSPNRVEDEAIRYAADAAVILDYLKLKDDWQDERSVKALSLMGALKSAVNKAAKRQGRLYEDIQTQLDRLSVLEAERSADIDAVADCFAKILELLFTPDFITDANTRRVLAWFGYNIGRWIYIIDAVNDMEKDFRDGSYNPFNVSFKGGDESKYIREVREKQEIPLTFTLENAAAAFELMECKRNESLLRSIVYDCLKIRQRQVINGERPSKGQQVKAIMKQRTRS